MLGVKKQTPTVATDGDTGNCPLLLEQQVQTLQQQTEDKFIDDNTFSTFPQLATLCM